MTKKRGWQNTCVWQAYDLRILWWSSLKSMFSGLLQKDLFKGGWTSPQKFFKQNYCHACDIRFAVFFPLPSCCIKYTISRMWLYFYHYHSPLYPASRAFLSLTWFWCTHERLYISWVRSLLGMQCVLLGYSFKPRPNSHVLGTVGSVMPISLTINGCLHLKKTVWRERTRLTQVQKFGLQWLQRVDTIQAEPPCLLTQGDGSSARRVPPLISYYNEELQAWTLQCLHFPWIFVVVIVVLGFALQRLFISLSYLLLLIYLFQYWRR